MVLVSRACLPDCHFNCLAITFFRAPALAKSYFLYFLGLLTLMTVLGIATPKRSLFILPMASITAPQSVTLVQSRVDQPPVLRDDRCHHEYLAAV